MNKSKEHYDHISGVNWWKEKIKCVVICSIQCSERICVARKNASLHYDILLLFMPPEVLEQSRSLNPQSYVCYADQTFEGEYSFIWEEHLFLITETPGHSPGSCCIMVDDNICFTGDTLLYNVPTITRLPGGKREIFKHTIDEYLKKIPIGCTIYPGHGKPFNYSEINFDII